MIKVKDNKSYPTFNVKKLKNEEGTCPFCHEHIGNYEPLEIEDNMIYYPWKCHNCGLEGEEWYSLTFAGHNVRDKDGNDFELE